MRSETDVGDFSTEVMFPVLWSDRAMFPPESAPCFSGSSRGRKGGPGRLLTA